MTRIIGEMPAYTYGTAAVATSPVSLKELEELKVSVDFTAEDERYLRRVRPAKSWRTGEAGS